MFTDIEGSTPILERLGDSGWLDVLRLHNALIREQVRHHGGEEIKATGDGFLVAFELPEAALRCATAIQQVMVAHRASDPECGLRVRIGLHVGLACRFEGDLYGRAVVVAARLCSAADGDQILVSAPLRELGQRSGVGRFGEGRPASLKGIAEAVTVHLMLWQSRPFAASTTWGNGTGPARIERGRRTRCVTVGLAGSRGFRRRDGWPAGIGRPGPARASPRAGPGRGRRSWHRRSLRAKPRLRRGSSAEVRLTL